MTVSTLPETIPGSLDDESLRALFPANTVVLTSNLESLMMQLTLRAHTIGAELNIKPEEVTLAQLQGWLHKQQA